MPDFEDPFKPSDATVLRPRPGAGRRTADQNPRDQTPRAAQPPTAPVEAPPPGALEVLGLGLNPLVQAASPLLMLAGQLRGTLSGPDIPTLRRHALDEIRRFEDRARAGGVQNEVVLAARYALCASLDEAVLSTPWGAQSEWAQQTLLVALHREAWGGEKFFEMLDRIAPDPKRHIDLMELLYLCLAFGFAGKYQVSDRGHARLSDVQHDLYRRIRDYRGTPPADLSLRWKGLEDRRNPLIKYVPWWVVGAAALAILALAYTFFYLALGRASTPAHTELAKVGLDAFTRPIAAAPAQGPTLRTLLAAEEASRAVSIEEEGGLTRVTLLAPDLFASGSAAVNPTQMDLLRRIAAALNQVPGRVMVVGHTDDQPVRTLRYRDNFALSRDRAVSVGSVLRAGLQDPGRVEQVGVGSTEPKYRPENTAENRARNRRVEILHVRGS
jgi:type VI secretion system protein ImpK